MNKKDSDRWHASRRMRQPPWSSATTVCARSANRIAEVGIEAGPLAAANRADPEISEAWIPGVEISPRTIYPQRHRGSFGELARRDEGALARIGLWPRPMVSRADVCPNRERFSYSSSQRPEGTPPNEWFRRLFVIEPENFPLRRYDEEQWDVMFFMQGRAEMILREARAGLPQKTMRLLSMVTSTRT